ncbi:hypothetical protein ACLX1H_003061 [Fusarium chlamydosporum]
MSSSSTIDINHSTNAVISWESDNATRILAKPDPKTSSITLSTHFDQKCAFFELSIPAKLKGVEQSAITLRVCASAITSLDLDTSPTVSDTVQQEFKSITYCLRLRLSHPPDVLLPTAALEPVCPARAPSGVVLDAIRELSQATAFSIYIEAREAPSNPGFPAVRDALQQGHFKSFRSTRFHLASMYGGLGAKLVNLSSEASAPPPSYNEVESSPPPPPVDSRKRPREDSEVKRPDDIALLWLELRAMKEARAEDQKRIEALVTENKKLRQDNKDLSQDVDTLRERCTALEMSQQNLKHSFEVLDTAAEELTNNLREELFDTFDNELTELRDDMRTMEGTVKFLEEGQVSDETARRIKDAVLQDITAR